MSEQETQADPQVEKEASALGWIPKEKFKGDPSRWTDAETFLKRGQEVMPILQANNRRLLETQNSLQTEVRGLKETLKSAQSAIEEFKKYHEEDKKRALQTQKTALMAKLKDVRKEGDDPDAEVELLDQLSEVNVALKEPAKKDPEPAKKDDIPEPDPEFLEWQSENPWFGKDGRKTALMVTIAQELRPTSKLEGKAFFEKCQEELDEMLGGGDSKPAASKVGPARGGGGRSAGNKSYESLPADAKAACDSFALTLVGEGKMYKDEKAWRDQYVKDFFASEE